jgi:hypothetical protein
MALQESALAGALKTIYASMASAAADAPKGDDWFAEQVAKAITDQIKTAGIAAGSVITAVSGGSGAPAVGTPNADELKVR